MLPALLLLLTLLPAVATFNNYTHRPNCVVLFTEAIYVAPLETALVVAKPRDLTIRKADLCFYPNAVASPKLIADNSTAAQLPGQFLPVFNSSEKPIVQVEAPILTKTINNTATIAPLAVDAAPVKKSVALINKTELESIRSQNRRGLEMIFSSECLFRLAVLLFSLNLFFFDIVSTVFEGNDNDANVMSRAVQTDDAGYMADDELTTASAVSEEDVFFEADRVLQEVLSDLDADFISALLHEQTAQRNRLQTISERSEPSDTEAQRDSDC